VNTLILCNDNRNNVINLFSLSIESIGRILAPEAVLHGTPPPPPDETGTSCGVYCYTLTWTGIDIRLACVNKKD